MSAVLPSPSAAKPVPRSEGVWHAAWRRMRSDRVGMVSMGVVLLFVLLIVLTATRFVAYDWQREVGVPSAPPTFMGPAPKTEQAAIVEGPKGLQASNVRKG